MPPMYAPLYPTTLDALLEVLSTWEQLSKEIMEEYPKENLTLMYGSWNKNSLHVWRFSKF